MISSPSPASGVRYSSPPVLPPSPPPPTLVRRLPAALNPQAAKPLSPLWQQVLTGLAGLGLGAVTVGLYHRHVQGQVGRSLKQELNHSLDLIDEVLKNPYVSAASKSELLTPVVEHLAESDWGQSFLNSLGIDPSSSANLLETMATAGKDVLKESLNMAVGNDPKEAAKLLKSLRLAATHTLQGVNRSAAGQQADLEALAKHAVPIFTRFQETGSPNYAIVSHLLEHDPAFKQVFNAKQGRAQTWAKLVRQHVEVKTQKVNGKAFDAAFKSNKALGALYEDLREQHPTWSKALDPANTSGLLGTVANTLEWATQHSLGGMGLNWLLTQPKLMQSMAQLELAAKGQPKPTLLRKAWGFVARQPVVTGGVYNTAEAFYAAAFKSPLMDELRRNPHLRQSLQAVLQSPAGLQWRQGLQQQGYHNSTVLINALELMIERPPEQWTPTWWRNSLVAGLKKAVAPKAAPKAKANKVAVQA